MIDDLIVAEVRAIRAKMLRECGGDMHKLIAQRKRAWDPNAGEMVTWNCTHINNAAMKPAIERCCAQLGYHCPVICTPLELQVNND